MRGLYRSIWADKLRDCTKLPVGGTVFSTDLTDRIKLDFQSFDLPMPNKFNKLYIKNKDALERWIKEAGVDIDPYTFFICYHVQKEVEKQLASPKPDASARQKIINTGNAKLSDLIGNAMCAEHAALGQYILQGLLDTSYMSGVIDHGNLEDHSFIVLGDQHIFDIARPFKEVPRVLKTKVPFKYRLFISKRNLLVPAEDVCFKTAQNYGVGNPWICEEPNVI